jgi:hypothetical protein
VKTAKQVLEEFTASSFRDQKKAAEMFTEGKAFEMPYLESLGFPGRYQGWNIVTMRNFWYSSLIRALELTLSIHFGISIFVGQTETSRLRIQSPGSSERPNGLRIEQTIRQEQCGQRVRSASKLEEHRCGIPP